MFHFKPNLLWALSLHCRCTCPWESEWGSSTVHRMNRSMSSSTQFSLSQISPVTFCRDHWESSGVLFQAYLLFIIHILEEFKTLESFFIPHLEKNFWVPLYWPSKLSSCVLEKVINWEPEIIIKNPWSIRQIWCVSAPLASSLITILHSHPHTLLTYPTFTPCLFTTPSHFWICCFLWLRRLFSPCHLWYFTLVL